MPAGAPALASRRRVIAEQLDPVAELLGVGDVGGLQLGDALDVRLGELHRHAEGDGADDRRLVRGVGAVDVEARVGLGVAQALRLGQRGGEVDALGAHLREDEVGGAVDDPGDPLDAVGGEALAQRLDDRDAAGHRRLEGDHHALVARRGEDLGAVDREQRLVGGDDVLARGDRLEHQRPGDAGAADQLDDDVDLRAGDHRAGIGEHLGRVADQGAGARGVEVGDVADADLAPGAAPDLLLVALEDGEGAAADDAGAEQPDLDRLHAACRACRLR